MDKLYPDAAAAVADVADGCTLAVGGFGLTGIPETLIKAVHAQGVRDLHVVSNNCGDAHGGGLGILLAAGRVRRVTGSYIGENKEFARQYLAGELEVELIPQGTLAERLRAGGCGIPAFYTPAGVGTQVAEGGLPWRYSRTEPGAVAVTSPPKETREFEGREYVLEHSIVADFGLVRAQRADRYGNLVFSKSARNFNPLAAMSGRIGVAEVEELVDALDPEEVHLPGVFVHRIVVLSPEQAADKRIEKRTVRA